MQPRAEIDEAAIDRETEEFIASCGGDPREAVRVLLEENRRLNRELALTRGAVSSGYSRQWHHRRATKS